MNPTHLPAEQQAVYSATPRFVIRLSTAKGHDVIRSETDDPRRALQAFVELTKLPLATDYDIGSNVTIVDTQSEWDGYWLCEGREAYSWKFTKAEAANAFLAARLASDCPRDVALLLQCEHKKMIDAVAANDLSLAQFPRTGELALVELLTRRDTLQWVREMLNSTDDMR